MKHRVIAITGLIGSGKSVVGSYLTDKGYCVVDCDKLAKELYESEDVVGKVTDLLGKNAVECGKLNTKYIRSVVFNDNDLLSKYNAIFHYKVKEKLIELSNENDLLFVEIPPISSFEFCWDGVWVIDTPKNKCIERASVRDNVEVANIESIIDNQKASFNDTVVISNDGTLEELYSQIDKLLSNL